MKKVSDENYKIRKMAAEDNEAVAALVRENLKAHELDIPGTAYYDSCLDDLYGFYAEREDREYYVLTNAAGRVVGGIGYAAFPPFPNCAELQKLYLEDAVKGQGLGSRLLEFIEERMRENGFCSSYLETHHNLRAALQLYEKAGYVKLERPKEVEHGAMDHFYYKELGEKA